MLSLASLASLSLMAAAQEKKPNIVLIVADDLGWGDVSAYGNSTIHTPNIDRLAQGGVCLTDGHATSATSTPSRYGLFTGMYPWKNEKAKILPGDAPLLIGTDQFTMPRMFQQAGYATAAIGKWHLGMGIGKIDWNREIRPCANDIGFDYSCVIAATVDRVPTVYVENGRVAGLDPDDPLYVDYDVPFEGEPTALTHPQLVRMQWSHGHQNTVVNGIPRIGYMKGGKSAVWDDKTMASYLLGKVEHFIDTVQSGRPFFLYYGLHEPHVPRVPATQFAGSTQLGPRGDVIMEADWCVGRVLDKLEAKGLLENTLVVFTSDNGPVLDDGYVDGSRGTRDRHDPNGGLRGGKYSLFDAGTRVPFFLYWKGTIKPVTVDALMSQQDLLASFARLIGADVPEGLDSQDLLDTFMGRSQKGRKQMVVEASGRLAYRVGQYALVPPYSGPETNETGNELGVVETYSLYDLKAEKSQLTDIAPDHPRLTGKFRKAFLKEAGRYYNPATEQETLK
ncbi:MAG: sulfatase-like hydrolase/transferase [Prevotella sp.]